MALGDDEVIRGDGLPTDRSTFTVSQPPQPRAAEADPPVRRHRLWSRKLLGGPRVSTLLLMSAWVALFVLYLQIRPGG
ncbi:hypothetical protein [Nocardia transvalensis]|uniref:hypothetical protein n=1 Tax=Nocardia transvalensis TaxID=37333 RepID=UPI001893434C|nr:hypothetical protein [Nocardia transvalensis]MBF6326964.1 hypothetical protein [Nocardia transvalensis]